MTWMLALVVALTGGFGASVRYLVDRAISNVSRNRGPLGIFTVNLTASLAAGFVGALLVSGSWLTLTPLWEFALLTGFLGGYSTFSTVMVDSLLLLESRRTAWVLLNTLGMFVLGVLATMVGAALAFALTA